MTLRVYDYECVGCSRIVEKFIAADRADEWLPCEGENCNELMFKRLPAPSGRVRGRADGNDRSDADRLTADMHGIKVDDLPPAMRADYKEPK